MKILWAKPAADIFRRLPITVREEISDRLELVTEFPEMYPVRTHQPYAGFRYFFTKNKCVSYTVTEDRIIILAIFHARRG